MNDIKETMAASIIVDLRAGQNIYVIKENAMDAVEFQIEELKEAGYIIVPKEPTDEMLKALGNSNASDINIAKGIYQAMTEASQNDK